MEHVKRFLIAFVSICLAVPFAHAFIEEHLESKYQIEHFDAASDIAQRQTKALRDAQMGIQNADYGEEIVFVLNDGIYVQFANGTGRRRIIQRGSGYSSFAYPAWSLDGTRIAFSGVYFYNNTPCVDLIVANADGSNPNVIATLNSGYYHSFMNSISWHWGNEHIMFSYWYDDSQGNTVAVVCTVKSDGTNFVLGPGLDRFYCQYEPVQNSTRYAYLTNGLFLPLFSAQLHVSNLNGSNDVLWWLRENAIDGFSHICWNNPNSIYTVVKNWDQYPGKEVLARVDKNTGSYTVIIVSNPACSLWSPTVSPGRTQLYISEVTSQTSYMYLSVLGANGLSVSVTGKGEGFYPNWRQTIPPPKKLINNDFNGDGQTDILWRYYGSGGKNLVWYMQGATRIGIASLPAVTDLNWKIGGTGDFNRDGWPDILWRYYGSGGKNLVWYMQGATRIGTASLLGVTDLNWQIVGTGDFNRDGWPDILWRYNGSGGKNLVWYMQGATRTGTASLPGVIDLNWQIMATGDFNRDEWPDILWRYYGSGGKNVVWYMQGATRTGTASLPAVTDLNWKVGGTGDFNGNGWPDILWRYYGSGGKNLVWYMQGATRTGTASLPAITDLNWRIENH
jgi:hypothetical protein